MLRPFSQRTAVAIALMSVLLFSVGTCVLPAQPATHGCCSHMSMPGMPLKSTCCTASPRIPPAVTTAPYRSAPALAITQQAIPAPDHLASRESVIAAVIPSHSPPPGNFILRI
jgi:hypothetical protein